MSPISCIIIDDDELARELLETYVGRIPFLTCHGSFENPLEGLSFLQSNSVDLLFLDIQMPELKGTDFAELIARSRSKIIFTTAYSEYAIKGFELNVLDYLLKPITFNRFLSAVDKFPRDASMGALHADHIVIKSGYDLHRIAFHEILYIASDSEYVHYHLENGNKIIANQSLSKLALSLPDNFLQVHRSYVVNGQKVSGLKGRELLIGNHPIPISDRYFEATKIKLFS